MTGSHVTVAPASGRSARQAIMVASVVLATAVGVWATWPRPDLTIRVSRGGSAVVVPKLGGSWRAPSPLPLDLTVKRGAAVRVINEDTAWARLGIFSAPPGDDNVARAPTVPGRFSGSCSAHPGRNMRIVVE